MSRETDVVVAGPEARKKRTQPEELELEVLDEQEIIQERANSVD